MSDVVETIVPVENTDDLDAFEQDFFGSAKPEEKEEKAEEVVTPVEDTDAEAKDEPEPEEETEEQEEKPEPESPKKGKKTAKERISELTAKNREKDARLAELEDRLARLEKPEKPTPVKFESKLVEPTPDDKDENGDLLYPLGELDPKYSAALVRYTLKVEREEAEAEAAKKAEQTAQEKADRELKEAEEKLVSDWDVKLEESAKEIPDLREKIVELDEAFGDLEPEFGVFIASTIMSMERGPEVLYYLAENIDEAEKIANSSPTAAVIALGRIEGRLAVKTEAKTKTTKAPEPPKVTRGTSAAKIIRADTDDLDAFEREFYSNKRTL